jgi:LysM domain
MKSFQISLLTLAIGLSMLSLGTQANIPPGGMDPNGTALPPASSDPTGTNAGLPAHRTISEAGHNTTSSDHENEDSSSTPSRSSPHASSLHARRAPRSSNHTLSRADIAPDAPQEYVVKKGDTLWGIAKRFLHNPWKWHALWQMNRKEIKNPHWIYPGDLIILEYDAYGRPYLHKGARRYLNYKGRLSPHARVEGLTDDAIPTISPAEIAPFLTKPLVINPGDLDKTPRIVGSLDERVVLGQGDIVYVKDLPNTGEDDRIWQIYRPGRPLVIRGTDEHGDPTERLLGYETIHLGDAKVRRLSEGISSVEIIRAKQEIMRGDRLIPAPKTAPMNYIPRAPEAEIDAEIIALPEGVAETGRNNVVAISAGQQDGLSPGHVLAIHRKGRLVKLPDDPENTIKLPDERVGLLMVFRTFEHVSYGLVMGSERQIQMGDRLHQP